MMLEEIQFLRTKVVGRVVIIEIGCIDFNQVLLELLKVSIFKRTFWYSQFFQKTNKFDLDNMISQVDLFSFEFEGNQKTFRN